MFCWFVELGIDDEVWDHSVFSKNRDRLLEAEIAGTLLLEYWRPVMLRCASSSTAEAHRSAPPARD
jgi:hypothetical protein